MSFPINHDMHIHTRLSGCCRDQAMRPQAILARAKAMGLSTICLTDHCWSKSAGAPPLWYEANDVANAQKSLPLPEDKAVKFLFGCETEYLGGQALGLTRADFDEFDFVVIPVNHFHSPAVRGKHACDTPDAFAELLISRLEQLLALDLPWRKIGLAHFTFCAPRFRDEAGEPVFPAFDESRLARCFSQMADTGAGIELNAQNIPMGKNAESFLLPYKIAKRARCRFYPGSDAHALDEMDWLNRLKNVTRALELDQKDWRAN